MLSSTIDALHEEVNRIKVKPYVELKNYDEKAPQLHVANESWLNFRKRNSSFLIDLMYGQFKSHITCPDCKKIWITFDPFNMVQLQIPFKKEFKVDYFSSILEKEKTIAIEYDVETGMRYDKFKQAVADKLEHKLENLIFFKSNNYYLDEDTEDYKDISDLREPYSVRLAAPSELAIDADYVYRVEIKFTKVKPYYYHDEDSRTTVDDIQPCFFDSRITCKSLHLTIF